MQIPLAAVRHTVRILIEEGQFDSAVETAVAAAAGFPTLRATTALWLADVLCQAGRPADALATLARAADEECAWEAGVVRNDHYIQSIIAELEPLIRASANVLAQEQSRLTPVEPVILLPPKGPRGSLICLHGRADRAQPGFVKAWRRAALGAGIAVVVPQSTRLTVWPDRLFGWTDLAAGQAEIGVAWQGTVANQPELGALPVVVGGMSVGADLAIQIALTGRPVTPVGFVAVAPAIRELATMPISAGAKLRGVLVVGAWDYRREASLGFWDRLTAARVPTDFVGVARVGHAMPPREAFEPRLRLVLEEIFGSVN